MAKEIERKFLVQRGLLPKPEASLPIVQGYLHTGRLTVRIRICGESAWLTLKGPTRGIERAEFEYPVPIEDARQMLDAYALPGRIEKTRHHFHHGGLLWEVDEFGGENAGLVIAEVELETAAQRPDLPPWIGAEVSGDPRYYNSNLAQNPYRTWPERDDPCNLSGGC